MKWSQLGYKTHTYFVYAFTYVSEELNQLIRSKDIHMSTASNVSIVSTGVAHELHRKRGKTAQTWTRIENKM